MFAVPPARVIYCYGIYQNIFSQMKGVEFIEGLPKSFQNYCDNNHNLIVIDDLQHEANNSKEVEQLFTRGSHHKNLTVIFLNQNLFYKGSYARTIALNCHYMVLFKNPRANSQIQSLKSQTGINNLLEAYKDATSNQYGYLVIDLHPASNPIYRMRTNIFANEDSVIYS